MARLLFAVTVSVGSLLLATSTDAADWLRFRGSDGSGQSPETGLPLVWSAKENIAWKTALPGPGSSSPIVVGDKIFLTCYSGYAVDQNDPGNRDDLKLHVVCLDRASGEIVWDESLPASPDEQKYEGQVAIHGYSTPTPVSDGEAVYCYFGVTGLVAYSLDGKLLWQKQLGTRTRGFGCAASPVVFEDVVIQNAAAEAESLVGLNKRTGEELWRVPEITAAWGTPLVVEPVGGEPELVLSRKNVIAGYNPLTGEQLWWAEGIDDYVSPSVIYHDGILYSLGGRPRMAMAVRAGGRGEVTESHRLWLEKSGCNIPSPVYLDGHLYFLDDRGMAFCVNAATGEVVYRERLARGRLYSSMVLADGRLYASTRDDGVFVLKASPEFEVLAHNKIEDDDSVFNSSPAVHNGQLLLRSDRFLYCIGQQGPGQSAQ